MTSKNKRMRGRRTHGHGSQKKARGAGGRGGRGMSGRFKHKKLWFKKHHSELLKKKKFKSLKDVGVEKPGLKIVNLGSIHGDAELKGFKVLARGTVKKGITVKAAAFSEKAREMIEKSGGKAVVLE